MIWLVVSAFTIFGFGQLFKWSQRSGCTAPVVVSVNYFVLGTLLLLYLLISGQLHLDASTLKVGVITGISFIVSVLVMTKALEIADVGAVLTAFRLAILIPILTAIFVWDEAVVGRQVGGILLACVALLLMTRGKNPSSAVSTTGTLWLLLAIFILQGVAHACIAWVHHAGLDDQRLIVLTVVAFTAGLLGTLVVLTRQHRMRLLDLRMGATVGLINLGALTATLTALSQVPATVFFAVTGCAVVILDNLSAQYYWKERLSTVAGIGAGLGALSMLLVM